MIQLFQNLLSNALKFRREGSPPCVKIYSPRLEKGKAQRSGFYEIWVEDNGIGFDEKHHKRIFSPFERLHGRGEYEETGMGLAIWRKIFESHRGEITARSPLGKGSVFQVTLPVPER